jgi:sec-independent protein translocase protein TatA
MGEAMILATIQEMQALRHVDGLLGIFGMPGHWEMLIILFVGLLLFGHRVPGAARSLGRGIVEFRKGLKGEDDKDEDEGGKRDPERLEKSREKKD